MDDAHISVENIVFRRESRIIFDDISLVIPRGKIVAVMGPSGTGKTTLLKMIGGQIKPDAGNIRVDGLSVGSLGRLQLFELRKRMGVLFQTGALFTDLSVFENVAFPLRLHTDLSEELVRLLVLMKLQSVGLRGASELMPQQLSGGMQRRVALARAIALDPEIIMYDEPFTGLDPIALGVIVELIRTLNNAFGTTSILVSHDIQETIGIADYVYVISDGKLIGEGKPEELMGSQSERVKQFMEGRPDGPVPFHYPAIDFEQELFSES